VVRPACAAQPVAARSHRKDGYVRSREPLVQRVTTILQRPPPAEPPDEVGEELPRHVVAAESVAPSRQIAAAGQYLH